MELLNMEIFGAVNALNTIFEMELPVRTSLSLAKLINKLNEPFLSIEKVRVGLVNKYGEKDSETNQTSIKPDNENFPKFLGEYNELMSQKTEIVFDTVMLPQEVNGKPLIIKPALMVALVKFVEIEPLTIVK